MGVTEPLSFDFFIDWVQIIIGFLKTPYMKLLTNRGYREIIQRLDALEYLQENPYRYDVGMEDDEIIIVKRWVAAE